MKTSLITLFLALLAITAKPQQNDTVAKIAEQCSIIDNFSNYQTDTLRDMEFLDEEFIKQRNEGYGLLTGYFKNDTLYKIHELYGTRLMKDVATTDYYFKNGMLIFVIEKEEYSPSVIVGGDGTTDHKINEPDFVGKYYFFKDKMIFKTTKGSPQILPNEMYFDSQSKEGQLLMFSDKNAGLLKKKNRKF